MTTEETVRSELRDELQIVSDKFSLLFKLKEGGNPTSAFIVWLQNRLATYKGTTEKPEPDPPNWCPCCKFSWTPPCSDKCPDCKVKFKFRPPGSPKPHCAILGIIPEDIDIRLTRVENRFNYFMGTSDE